MSTAPLHGRRIAEVLATSTGGVGTHVRSLVGPLGRAGALLRVCGPAATDELFGFGAAGAAFRPVQIGPVPGDPRAVLALARATRGADLVHAHGLRAGLVAALSRHLVPHPAGGRASLVLTLHNALQPSGGAGRWVLSRVEAATIRAADLVLAASGDLADNAWQAGARDVRVAPVSAPPLPAPTRDRDAVRAELGVPDGRPLVVAVGRLHPQKSYGTLLDAAAEWSDPTAVDTAGTGAPVVVVAGDGPQEAELSARIAAERLPVTLLGRRTDVADLLAAADVCVLPSVWEARSLTAQEALRSGTPLVATRVGGIPELVGDAAVLVPPGDAAALAGAVRDLLADPARAGQLADAGRVRAAQWPDDADTARGLVAVYRELLGAPA
ncbi:glycosyltransferase family 4 protein [Klenkia sp. LSe6-5]|uniref:Glycosyltransferase family 4 protein n=1 Tax=Klenkia sesuvii TaxID=3103137 RepID=A0ABU8DSU8_9ACTN